MHRRFFFSSPVCHCITGPCVSFCVVFGSSHPLLRPIIIEMECYSTISFLHETRPTSAADGDGRRLTIYSQRYACSKSVGFSSSSSSLPPSNNRRFIRDWNGRELASKHIKCYVNLCQPNDTG